MPETNPPRTATSIAEAEALLSEVEDIVKARWRNVPTSPTDPITVIIEHAGVALRGSRKILKRAAYIARRGRPVEVYIELHQYNGLRSYDLLREHMRRLNHPDEFPAGTQRWLVDAGMDCDE